MEKQCFNFVIYAIPCATKNAECETNDEVDERSSAAEGGRGEEENVCIYNTNNEEERYNDGRYACWYCTCFFEGIIFKAIKSYNHKSMSYKTYGIFCSVMCLKAFLLKKNINEYSLTCNYTMKMYRIDLNDVKESPNPYLLKKFGGAMTEEEYKKILNEAGCKKCEIIEYEEPIIPHKLYSIIISKHSSQQS